MRARLRGGGDAAVAASLSLKGSGTRVLAVVDTPDPSVRYASHAQPKRAVSVTCAPVTPTSAVGDAVVAASPFI